MGNSRCVNTRFFIAIVITGLIFFSPGKVHAQSPFAGLEKLFTMPANYIVHYTKTAPVIDGDINDDVWKQAAWTNDFQDIEGDSKPRPSLKTKTKMLWDDSCIYIAAQIEEPQVWAYLQKHDEIIYHDNDFEVFISPRNSTQQYYELEFNALNTVLDLFMDKPYRDGGNPMINWDAKGLRSAVKIQGTLNNPDDTDKGWTVEIAIPIKAISTSNKMRAPQEGTLWRINFSRVEWDTKAVDGKYVKLTDSNGYARPEHNWVWSAQGVIDMHFPERWGYLQFTKSDDPNVAFAMPYAEQQKQYLWLIYYREQMWYSKHGEYVLTLKELGLGDSITIDNKTNALKLEATAHQFMGFITDDKDKITRTINNEGLARELNHREHE
jgi:hypothetical protein